MSQPEKFDLEIVETSATPLENGILLEARVNSIDIDVYECGFYYGLSEDNLKKCTVELVHGKFSVVIVNLEHSKKYVYKAFVSNGRNIIYSRTGSFIAVSKNSDGDEPGIYNVELSHLQQFCIVDVFPTDVDLHSGEITDWLSGWTSANGAVVFGVSENETFKTRSAQHTFHIGFLIYSLNITQYSTCDIVDFKDSKIKEICVSQFDRNSDGELWFNEVTGVTRLSSSLFAGVDFTSFDELRFFNNASLGSYLFEGSSVVSAILPTAYRSGTGMGIFKNCKNLERIDLGGRNVETEAFMNCSALKSVPRMCVVGARAFMSCTALENVVQRDYSVPEMAFKNCTSLRSFSFDPVPILPENETIGEEAFSGCTSLSEIAIIPEIESIDARAFYGCSSLQSVSFTSICPPIIGTDAFTGTHPDLKLYVPAPLVPTYKSAWPQFADRIESL